MIEVDDETFEEYLQAAVKAVPKKYADKLSNVSFAVAEWPTLRQGPLLGLYEGVPLPARSYGYSGVVPDVITVFKGPHERMAHSLEQLREEVRHTVWHEVAHYFGLNHDRIHALEK